MIDGNMSNFLLDHYLIIKALHVIAVIAWLAGLLYLPRLFVYHAQAESGSDKSETFKVMERKLLRAIMNPAMIAVWIFGILMIVANPSLLQNGWLHVKLTCVVLLTILHHVYSSWRKMFMRDQNKYSPRFYRWWNEAPTALMIIIVFMVILKPF